MVALMAMRNVEHWHTKHHQPGPIESCWDCGKQKAKCKSKLFRYEDRDAAVLEARLMNEADSYVRPRTAYQCPWCNLYHHTTHLRTHNRDAVTKQQRKWLFKQELERRACAAGLPVDDAGSA